MVSGDAVLVALWGDICQEADRLDAEWIEQLRRDGIKAAHPNDGWVDRVNNQVGMVYPHFDDGAQVGDLMVIGWRSDLLNNRVVRITGKSKAMSGRVDVYSFEDV